MQLIDTHTHIYLSAFDNDREAVLQRAIDTGVSPILLPAIDTTTHTQMLLVELRWPQHCQAMMGLHPCSVKAEYVQELAAVEAHLRQRKFIAIGEIGLDFYWDTTFKQQQYYAFEAQIQLALQYNLPIVIHSRNAIDECIAVVKKFPKLRGVFHCFSGTVAQATQITESNFYLGIGGVATYKNAGLDVVLSEVGLKAVLLETDAPYLSPVPHRGKRNESSYVPLVAAKLSQITNQSIEAVAAVTTQNARELFGLT